jgi:hypothetical protein
VGGFSPLVGGYRPLFVRFSPLLSGIPLSSFGPDEERAEAARDRGMTHEERGEAALEREEDPRLTSGAPQATLQHTIPVVA